MHLFGDSVEHSRGRASAQHHYDRYGCGTMRRQTRSGFRSASMRLLVSVALATLVGLAAAHAQVYPSRPVTMVVPFPAGGSTDAVARIVAERMRLSLGQ